MAPEPQGGLCYGAGADIKVKNLYNDGALCSSWLSDNSEHTTSQTAETKAACRTRIRLRERFIVFAPTLSLTASDEQATELRQIMKTAH